MRTWMRSASASMASISPSTTPPLRVSMRQGSTRSLLGRSKRQEKGGSGHCQGL
jgi:hypothetical protein